jgi:formylmethanofuran dehydrogenase subunit B
VDPRKTLTAETSNLLVQLKPNSDYELISALLTLLHGKTPHPSVEDITGVSIPVMEKMLDLMKNCNFGTISVGLGLSSSMGKHRNAEIAMNLVKELNNYSKFTFGVIKPFLLFYSHPADIGSHGRPAKRGHAQPKKKDVNSKAREGH